MGSGEESVKEWEGVSYWGGKDWFRNFIVFECFWVSQTGRRVFDDNSSLKDLESRALAGPGRDPSVL